MARKTKRGRTLPRRSGRSRPAVALEWSSGRHALAAHGTRTAAALVEAIQENPEFSILAKLEDDELKQIAGVLHGWTDRQAALAIQCYDRHLESRRNVDVCTFCRWLRQHPSDSDAVAECLAVVPPQGMSVIKLLSRAGSQKRVFLATWRLTQKEIVLKQLIGPLERQEAISDRESQTHPLAMGHPNIIETHPLTNAAGERFLAEEYLPVSLNDRWESRGVQEAANLLYDVCKALDFLHVERKRVHGDVKPDNIGGRDGSYVLLDFGICRRISEFTREMTATGSLRTRAPELFEGGQLADPTKVDVWAAAATVFRTVAGRFPFIDAEEKVPRISNPRKRTAFEREVARRVRDEWDSRVKLALVPEPLRAVLADALVRDPANRATAEKMVDLCERHLAGFLRTSPGGVHFSAGEELAQLLDFLPRDGSLARMPLAMKQVMKSRLNAFRQSMNLADHETSGVESLLTRLGS